jgi:DNA-binding transcriptional regulator YhcF (GntR family)
LTASETKNSQFRTASLERILGDKAEHYFRTMEKAFFIADQKQML